MSKLIDALFLIIQSSFLLYFQSLMPFVWNFRVWCWLFSESSGNFRAFSFFIFRACWCLFSEISELVDALLLIFLSSFLVYLRSLMLFLWNFWVWWWLFSEISELVANVCIIYLEYFYCWNLLFNYTEEPVMGTLKAERNSLNIIESTALVLIKRIINKELDV